MYLDLINKLICQSCNSDKLSVSSFEKIDDDIIEGVLFCGDCFYWYPIEDGVLDLLTGKLVDFKERNIFWDRYKIKLEKLNLQISSKMKKSYEDIHQLRQQKHFDLWANDSVQTYSDFCGTKFWHIADEIAVKPWLEKIEPNTWMLDIGCGQGRSTFIFEDKKINIAAFDVSKQLVIQARKKYKDKKSPAKISFIVADAVVLPFKNACFDYILVYGVLHHLPNPENVCQNIVRIMKDGGRYFGHENNHSIFRFIFDLLQRFFPKWHEEAGDHETISHSQINDWLSKNGLSIKYRTSIWVPPHLIDLLPKKIGRFTFLLTELIGKSFPILNKNGGILLIEGTKNKL
tara:strand:- start:68 stop:1102 length:1035 start_codon:yes stop_codon:yes gene_type:complete